jgi:hypothetical protein
MSRKPKVEMCVGNTFNALTAIRFSRIRESRILWLFSCECGRTKELEASRVANGITKSCGCRTGKLPKPPTDVTGQKWGQLTALSFSHRSSSKNALQYWTFKCDCGGKTTEPLYKVRNGYVGSCGCVGKRGLRERARDLKRAYDLSNNQLDDFLIRLEGSCEICGSKCAQSKRLSVDHCHRTKTIRGAICQNCNRLLGLAKDSSFLLRSAATYLERYEHAS